MILAMTDTMRDFGTAAAIVLGIAGFCIGGAAFLRLSLLVPRVDLMEDKLTPSFAEELAEADTDPAIPAVPPVPRDPERTDTEENDMPRQVEQAKLEAERGKTYRTFTLTDGSVRRFEVKE